MDFKIKDGVLVKYTGTEVDVIVPDEVTVIGKSAFSSYSRLNSVVLPKGITEIEADAFRACYFLKEINFPDGLKVIGREAFYNCANLKNVKFPDSLEVIQQGAFNTDYSSFEEVYIPKNVKEIGRNAFNHIERIAVDPENQFYTTMEGIVYNKDTTELVCIPRGVCGCITIPDGVKIIPNRAFYFFKSIDKVVLPSTITEVGKMAFSGTSIKEIRLPSSVHEIGLNAFAKCKELVSISMPGVEKIGEEAFYGSGIKEIIFPSYVREIGKSAFKECKELVSISMSGVEKIGEEAFYDSGIKEIIFPSSVHEIGESAFGRCIELVSVTISDVENIARAAFIECSSLKEVFISEDVKSIGEYAFYGCESIESIEIPASVKTIDKYAFAECKSLKKVIIKNKATKLMDYAFVHCDSLADTNGFVIVNNCLFDYCQDEDEITIPEGVEIIQAERIFAQKVHFPDTLKQIGKDCEFSWNIISNIPKGFLQQTQKLNGEPVAELLESKSWKESITDKDLAALQLFQSSNKILKEIESRITENPDSILKSMCELLREKGRASHYQKAAEFYFAHKTAVSQDTVNALNAAAVDAKAKKTIELLAPYVTDAENKDAGKSKSKISANAVKTDGNPIEDFCKENFVPFAMEKYIKKLGLKETAFKNVKYRDSDSIAPIFIVECAIVPYMKQLTEKPREIGNYKKDYLKFHIDPVADKVAQALDQESFQAVFDVLLGNTLPAAQEVLVPYGRFASGKQITALNSRLKEWERWDYYAANGRKAIIVAHGALLLNDSREAMLIADKIGILGAAAGIRNTTAEALRDTLIADFSFDPNGKKRYDLGNTTIELVLKKDLSLQMYDVESGKTVKTLPKKGNDINKLEIASADISDIKKNIKNVIKNRISALKKDFVGGWSRTVGDWKASYTTNPVLKKIAEIIVWNVKDKSSKKSFGFMLKEDGTFVNADGVHITLPEIADISVAHPLMMAPDEVAKWRKYLKDNSIAQPFTQMFEPVYSCDIESLEKRYAGTKLPFYLIKKLEKDGFEIAGSRENGFEVCLGYSIRLELIFDSRGVYSAKMIPIKENIELGRFKVRTERMTKTLNHVLYLLDSLCFESMVRANNVAVVSELTGHLTEKNILRMIDAAEESKSSDCLAWLMDYKNTNYPDMLDDLDL